MTQCQQLLQEREIDQAVRVGDIYGVIVEYVITKSCFPTILAACIKLTNKYLLHTFRFLQSHAPPLLVIINIYILLLQVVISLVYMI